MKNIEVYVDVSCPFSYVGGERIIQFLEDNNASLDKLRFRSFQLEPDDDNTNTNYMKIRFEASGIKDLNEYKDFFDNIIGEQIKSVGLDYNLETVIRKNTIHAHMGLQYATLFGKQAEYFRKVTKGHFAEGRDYYDFDFIDDILKELDLDIVDFHNREEEMKNLVENDILSAEQRGVKSVPTFYRDKILLSGTGSYEKFKEFM